MLKKYPIIQKVPNNTLDFYGLNRIFNVCSFLENANKFYSVVIFIYYKSKKLRGSVGMGEAVNTIPSILNKCLFVSPLAQTQMLHGGYNIIVRTFFISGA